MQCYVNDKYSLIQLELGEDLLLGKAKPERVHSPIALKE